MAEILVLWMLGMIVIAIAWGGIDKIAAPLKTLAQSLQTPKRSKRLQIAVAGLMALAVLSIMAAAADNNMEEGVGLPALLIWAGGLWLIPFRFDMVGHYWLSFLAIAIILVPFWVGKTSSHVSTRADVQVDVSTQQGQDKFASATGLGVLFWIFLIGLTVAAIARYTSAWNTTVLNS